MSRAESPTSNFKRRPLSPFVSKLKVLLSESKYEEAIRWSSNGEAIVIFDADTFKRIVLDKTAEMFKTKNFASFVRQLNLYGFRKVPTNGKSDPNKYMKFEHPHFSRSKPQMMHLVQRTCSSSKKRKTDNASPGVARNGEPHSRQNAAWLVDYYRQVGETTAGNPYSPAKEDTTNHDNEQFALEYMYQKFQEEQHAVQLLMYLKYSPPNPLVFPGAAWNARLEEGRHSTQYSTANLPNTRLCHCFSCHPCSFKATETARQN